METSFDPAKRDATLKHRGLDFADAGQVFSGAVLEYEDDRFDYGDAPELDQPWFDKAVLKVNGLPVKRGRGRPAGSDKEQVTLRLDSVVLDRFRATGPGWQTRINEALRAASTGLSA